VTKRELVIDVAERLGYTQNEVANVVQASLDAITECLANGQRIEIRNFGVFEIKTRDARIGRNPRTGQEVPISEKRVATFKPGKALKERVEVTSATPASDAPRPVATARLGSGLAVVEEEGGQFRLL
jgi:nucleoid DNA-binding protein